MRTLRCTRSGPSSASRRAIRSSTCFLCCVTITTLIECQVVSADVCLGQAHGCLGSVQTILLEECSLDKHAVEQVRQLVQRVLPRPVQPAQLLKESIILSETRAETHASKTNSSIERMNRVGEKVKPSKRLQDDEDGDEEWLQPVEEVENRRRRTKHINAERSTTASRSGPSPRDFLSPVAGPVVSFLSKPYVGKWEDEEDEENEEGEAEEIEGEEEQESAEEEGPQEELLQFDKRGRTGRKKRRAARRSATQRKKVQVSQGHLSMIAVGVMRFLCTPSGLAFLLLSTFACAEVVMKQQQLDQVSVELKDAQRQLAENTAREKELLASLASAHKTNEISKQNILPKAEADKAYLVERLEKEKAALKDEIDKSTQSATARVTELETAVEQPVGEQQGRSKKKEKKEKKNPRSKKGDFL